LTSHLHTPTLRLVSLHPLLSVSLYFLRVPEIHDGFAWKTFFARSTTVREVINLVTDELGLTKALPVPGGGTIEYVLEEVWVDGQIERTSFTYELPLFHIGDSYKMIEPTRVPVTSVLSEVLETPHVSKPLSRSATREFRFCVPDEWYRRSKPRSLSTASLTPSEATIKHLAELEDDLSDGEGTAKQKHDANSPPPNNKIGKGDWKETFSQNRISTFFDGWLPSSNTSHNADSPPLERMSVSEPKLLDQSTVEREMLTKSEENASDEDEGDLADFHQMVVRPLHLRAFFFCHH
jgi:diaphanous 1